MKKTLSILLAAAMLLISAPGSAYAVDTLSDPVDQIETPAEKPDPVEVERIIREFLRDEMHLNEAVTSGILANIYVECKFNPGDRYLESGGYTSYGICQWNRDRLQEMIDYCKDHGYQPSDVRGQLGFMKHELETSEKNAYRMLRAISNDAAGAYEAGYNWARYYERSSSSGHLNRANLAKNTYWPIYGKYLPINLNVPYFSSESGDTLSACVAMTEAYLAGYSSEDSRVTEGIAGLDVTGSYAESAADPEAIFTAVQKGIPVILRSKTGYSVLVYGYDGESTELDPAGFRLLIPTASGELMPGSYGRLPASEQDLSGYSVLIRKDLAAALPLCEDGVTGLSLSGFAHPVGLTTGSAILLGGRLTSDKAVVSVDVELTDADGKTVASVSAEPGATNCDLALLPKLPALSAGDYTLTLTAKDASGATLVYTDPLSVSALPMAGRTGESGADPFSEEEGRIPGVYRITAKSGLNVRSGPSTSTSKLTAIPYGTTVTVTEVTDGWGKTSYEGKTGWISMEYTEFVSGGGFVISYDGNGGSDVPASAIKQSGTSLTLSAQEAVRTGYRFLGWSVDRFAVTPEYKPGDSYTGNSELRLFAIWEEIIPVYGDVNADGVANMKDTVLLQQYLNGYDVRLDYAASDLDFDGILSMRDIARLQRYLNGYEE